MKLQYDGRLPAFEPFDQRPLPQRPGPVEAAHTRNAGEIEHGRERLRGRHFDGAEMPREIEVGVDRPPGRCEPQRRFDDPVPEAGHGAARPLGLVTQQLGVGTAVEDEHHHHRRAQQRVALHVPAERVAGSHVRIEVLDHRGSPSERYARRRRTASGDLCAPDGGVPGAEGVQPGRIDGARVDVTGPRPHLLDEGGDDVGQSVWPPAQLDRGAGSHELGVG